LANLFSSYTFIFSTVGFTATAFTTGALAQWAPTFIQRVSEMIYGEGHGYGDSTYVTGQGGREGEREGEGGRGGRRGGPVVFGDITVIVRWCF
jgi:hypothetical protein